MVKRRTGDKPGDIRRATIAEVVECGSSAASINAIAKRAGLAVGTLYRYHENKEHLLRSVQMEIKTDLHNSVMAAAQQATTAKGRIRAMWFAILTYARENPDAFLYSEVVMNTALLSEAERARIEEMLVEGMGVIETAMDEGVVRRGNLQAVRTVLVAPALHLGRAAAFSNKAPDDTHAKETFDLCWKAIAT